MKTNSRSLVRLCILAGALALAPAAHAADPDITALKAEAAAIMKVFGGSLQAELKAAMERGGPVEAIQVCAAKAVPLADKASAESGWSVGRTSHKLRNPRNAPDAFEQAVLDDFLARQAKGEAAADMAHAAVVDGPDGKVFRFVKAIPTGEPCLACHGSTIAPEVAKELDSLYPGDAARGFSAGQMRGVFTLSKPL
ncbi:DUF3365 domain-containing protein [Novispirillum sp. DQ9]|uniref:Tll0287-like domain-containing protein n=1 Tax=Novispirillum sp. DQ9 TaxID=3398612 RepID=UPI003C7A4375